jgi:hypothetical protein
MVFEGVYITENEEFEPFDVNCVTSAICRGICKSQVTVVPMLKVTVEPPRQQVPRSEGIIGLK